MWSTPSRSRDASQAWRTYSGRPFTRRPSGVRWLPNFVASTTSSLRPLMASPTSRSLVKGPYASAVSRSVTPRSRARRMVATDSSSSPGPKDWLMPMQPRPSSETARPRPGLLCPSVRSFISCPSRGDPWTDYWVGSLGIISGAGLVFVRRRQARPQHVSQEAGIGRSGARLPRPDHVTALELGGYQFLQRLAVAVPVLRGVEIHGHRADQGCGHLQFLRVHLDVLVKERKDGLAERSGPQQSLQHQHAGPGPQGREGLPLAERDLGHRHLP